VDTPSLRLGTISTPFGEAYPQIQAHLAGTTRWAILDKGAWLTYVPEDTVHGLAPEGVEQDFLPGYGEFTTSVYKVAVDLGDADKHRVSAGVLPADRSAFILGTELYHDRAD
jgi:hypothetical protein